MPTVVRKDSIADKDCAVRSEFQVLNPKSVLASLAVSCWNEFLTAPSDAKQSQPLGVSPARQDCLRAIAGQSGDAVPSC